MKEGLRRSGARPPPPAPPPWDQIFENTGGFHPGLIEVEVEPPGED